MRKAFNSDSSKNALQLELNDASKNLDRLKTTGSSGDSLIKTKHIEISDLTHRIQAVLNDKNATEFQLAEGGRLIAELKTNIETYTAQIEQLPREEIIKPIDNTINVIERPTSYSVISEKSYFYTYASEKSKRNAYVQRGDEVKGSEINGWINAEFINAAGKSTTGYLKSSTLQKRESK